jgi:hypothetical protein
LDLLLEEDEELDELNINENVGYTTILTEVSTNPMIIYHGNKDKDMIPKFGVGKKTNDYGRGFYTTPNKELGKEWAYSVYCQGDHGYIHTYELDINGLNILDLTKKYCLHWIAELLFNRNINTDGKEALQDTIEDFIEKYKLDTSTV